MTDKELLEQFQMLAGMIQDTESRLREEIRQSETRSKIYIDDKVSKRLDSLTDGYKLTHEKQYELERKVEALERRLEALENRTA